MKKQQFQSVLMGLGLAVSVGCTVPFLVNPDGKTDSGNGQVVTDPANVSSSLPIFLPQPGSSSNPTVLQPTPNGGLSVIGTPNPSISGPLPSAEPTPFLADVTPNIDNQIGFNPLPTLQAAGSLTSTQPIIKSVIKGRVLGLNLSTERYEPLSNAQVRIDSLSLSTDANGFYQTTQEFDKAITISAAANNYMASTVSNVPPGINRDIHLNPLNERPAYRQEAFRIDGSITNLAQNGKRPLVVFTDGNGSTSNAAFPASATGRFAIDVRVKANRSTTTGSLFASVMENVGKLSMVTQYGYSPTVNVPVSPDQPVPTPTPSTTTGTSKPLKSTNLLLSFDHLVSPEAFGELKVNISAESGSNLQGSVLHVYMNLPGGGRVLVAKYNDNTATTINQTIRVPRVTGTSFTVVAHAGSSQRGSDIVVPSLQIGSSVTKTFLKAPVFNQIGDETDFTNPNKTHFSTSDTTPQIGWNSQPEVNSYQLEIQAQIPEAFRWEAYTLDNRVTYPDFGTDHPLSLDEGQTYRLQLMASDFDIGTFNILSQKADFGVKLLNPTLSNFAQGYRISYSSISFVTE